MSPAVSLAVTARRGAAGAEPYAERVPAGPPATIAAGDPGRCCCLRRRKRAVSGARRKRLPERRGAGGGRRCFSWSGVDMECRAHRNALTVAIGRFLVERGLLDAEDPLRQPDLFATDAEARLFKRRRGRPPSARAKRKWRHRKPLT